MMARRRSGANGCACYDSYRSILPRKFKKSSLKGADNPLFLGVCFGHPSHTRSKAFCTYRCRLSLTKSRLALVKVTLRICDAQTPASRTMHCSYMRNPSFFLLEKPKNFFFWEVSRVLSIVSRKTESNLVERIIGICESNSFCFFKYLHDVSAMNT